MATPKNTPETFTDSELREALRFYRQLKQDGEETTTQVFAAHFRCSMARASMLRVAAEFAVRVQKKEKAKFIETLNKRKATGK